MEIAIDAGEISDPGIIGNIYADIDAELLPIDPDIVDINTVSDAMKKKILEKGVVLHK